MSIGVIPIIFAIIGIILSVEHEIPKIAILKKMINPLILLIVLGGVTEAVAFFFGFLFPEPEIPTKAGREFPEIKDLIDAIKNLPDKVPSLRSEGTEGTVEIGNGKFTVKFKKKGENES